MSYRLVNTAVGRPFQLHGAWKEIPTKPHSTRVPPSPCTISPSGEDHPHFSLWRTVRHNLRPARKFGGRQTVLQDTPHNKCGRGRTTRSHVYAKRKCQAFHRSLDLWRVATRQMEFLVVNEQIFVFRGLNWTKLLSPHEETFPKDAPTEDTSLSQHWSAFKL